MIFHQTDTLKRPGGSSEKTVWDALRAPFGDRAGQAFWRFPIFSKAGERRKEPDLLVLDQEFGVLVFEVKGYTIHNIVGIRGHLWQMRDAPTPTSNPYQQAEDAGWALKNRAGRLRQLRDGVPVKVVVALPNITRSEWRARKFGGVADPESHLVFSDDLSPGALLKRLQAIPFLYRGNPLSEAIFAQLQSAVTGLPCQNGTPDGEVPTVAASRVEALERTAAFVHEADIKQIQISTEIPPGFQQIRGIAGSGKTVLLCQKAAAMHLKCPDWQIALVFFTRSLYEQVREHLDRALKYQSCGEVSLASASSCIHVLHAWGAVEQPGFYRRLAQASGMAPMGLSQVPQASQTSPSRALAYVSERLLKKAEAIEQLYDVILMDEAQDLLSGDKLDGREPFFWLAYQSLRPMEGKETERRLIWAYDEAQSLDNLTIPTAKDILGEDFKRVTSGSHEGNILRTHVMKKCYRTPGPILIGAAAIGMGLLRPAGILAGITNKEGWEKIGYRVTDGQFTPGSQVTLSRPIEHSPNPIPRISNVPPLRFFNHADPMAEKAALLASIQADLKDGIAPERILVLVPHADDGFRRLGELATHLKANGIPVYKAASTQPGEFLEPRGTRPDMFRWPGHLTISFPTRAKGNEVDLVYLVSLHLLENQEAQIKARNQIFTCMTRAKGWCCLSGSFRSSAGLAEEIKACVDQATSGPEPEFTFTYRRPQRELDDGEFQAELPL